MKNNLIPPSAPLPLSFFAHSLVVFFFFAAFFGLIFYAAGNGWVNYAGNGGKFSEGTQILLLKIIFCSSGFLFLFLVFLGFLRLFLRFSGRKKMPYFYGSRVFYWSATGFAAFFVLFSGIIIVFSRGAASQ